MVRHDRGKSGLRTTLVGSVMAHALVVAIVPPPSRTPRPAPEPPSIAEFELSPLPQPVVPEAPRHPPPRTPAVTTPRPVAPEPEPSEPTPSPAEVVPTPPPVEASTAPAPSPVVSVPGGLRIDPRAVALAVQPGPSSGVPRAAEPGVVEPSAAERERALEAAVSRDLAGAANARPWVSRRGPPDLHRRSDGSYVYAGTGFSARIAADGSISFSDRSTAGFDGFGNSQRQGITAHFDLNDVMFRRRGNDPYQAERSWFMRETEELRNRLSDTARGEQAVTATRTVRGRLLRIWQDEGRTPEQRRQAIFRIWDDCAEDETGEAIRHAVVGWVREQLPHGSEGAYTDVELARLNAGRDSASPFRPY
ncbi:MAG: hypothetical protein U0230_03905 [Polyangiales bacterium]